jgi:hypothetical protein
MPIRDKTGPEGKGPKTGRQEGNCQEATPTETGIRYGRGRRPRRFGPGIGLGRSFGAGFGRGLGILGHNRFSQTTELTKTEEKKVLVAELKEIEAERKEIEKRLKELK